MTTAKDLSRRWGVNVRHALFNKDGDWYHRLERFPGALFDRTGYVRFPTRDEYAGSPYLQIRQHVHVPIGISQMPGYVQVVGFSSGRRRASIVDPLKGSRFRLAKTAGDVRVSGGGFGTPIENRYVEKAACAAIRRHFQHRGYTVRSREKEKLGYDFDVRRGRELLHVEVKGVSGTALKFPITANEVSRASRDRHFCLAVVTSARTRSPKIYLFDSKVFFTNFRLSALAFCAECTVRSRWYVRKNRRN